MSVIKRVGQDFLNSRKMRQFSVFANQAKRKHFALNGGERVISGGKSPQNFFYFVKSFSVGFNSSQARFVEISERGFCRKFASPDFLSNTAQNVFSQIVGVIFCLSKGDAQHKFSLRCRFKPKCGEF
ncbi:MAG: hypothetical protein WCR84_01110 [Candidatus Paceibacterota bacterium]|nr:hypothetical protein [Candidatus Paceibacterota bacterium]